MIFKVFESQPEVCEHELKPGFIVSDGKNFFKVACSNGFINIITIQLEGKKRMNSIEFLRGFNIAHCTIAVN
jgi:methionyl-tRNA formyltransferase